MWKNLRREAIFSDFAISVDFDLPLDQVEKDCHTIMNRSQIVNRSNVGGRQSEILFDCELESLKQLQSLVSKFTLDEMISMGFDIEKTRNVWWVNINESQSYNQIHTHGRSDLIGIYYIKAPKDSGKLCVVRNDGLPYTSLVATNNQNFRASLEFDPIPNKFYLFPGHVWHHVTENRSKEDRISISFNIEVQ